MNKKTNYNIVFLRFLAIIIVVFGHSIIIYDSSWGLYTSNFSSDFLAFVKQIINIVQMPLWFSISGFLFYSKKKKHFFEFLSKKIKKLIIPFLIFGLFYLIPIRYIIHYNNYICHSILYNVFYNFLLGFDNGHLWYLPTLFIIMILSIFLYMKHNKVFDIFLFLLFFIFNLLSYHFKTYFFHVFYYFIFFYIGYCLHKYNIHPKKRIWILVPYLVIAIIFKLNHLPNILNNIFILILQIIFVVVIFNIDFKNLGSLSFISNIASQSFGIYLFHSPLIYITFSKYPNLSPFLMVFINFVLFGGLSFLLTKIIRSSKLKWIVGE